MRISTHTHTQKKHTKKTKNIACSQRQMQVNTRRRNSTRIYVEDVCTSFRAERRKTLEALASQHGKRGKRSEVGVGGGGSKKWRKGRGVLNLFPTKEVAFLQRTRNVYLKIVATRGKGE